MSYPSSTGPTPNTLNRTDTDGLSAYRSITLADGLSSGSSPAEQINAESADGIVHVEAVDSQSFDIEVQYRPDDGSAWGTLKQYTDSDTNDSDAILESVIPVQAGEYRVLHNSGTTVTVILKF